MAHCDPHTEQLATTLEQHALNGTHDPQTLNDAAQRIRSLCRALHTYANIIRHIDNHR